MSDIERFWEIFRECYELNSSECKVFRLIYESREGLNLDSLIMGTGYTQGTLNSIGSLLFKKRLIIYYFDPDKGKSLCVNLNHKLKKTLNNHLENKYKNDIIAIEEGYR